MRATMLLGLGLLALPPSLEAQAYRELQNLSQVLNHVRVNYMDRVDYADLVEAAIEGVLRSLDPHSYYVSRGDWNRLNAISEGRVPTVGLDVEDVGASLVVLSVREDGPADDRGVRAGDRIVTINDTTVAGLSAQEVTLRLSGDEGSKIRLEIERGSDLAPERFSVELRRELLDPETVTAARMLDGATGYLRLRQFGTESAEELERAARDLEDDGMEALILDLRGNPGGAINTAFEIAALFLEEETLVFGTEGRKADVNQEFVTERNGRFRGLPLAVLIDEGSASASEAVAGSFQDHARAVIVGRRSFGKALMQVPLFVADGVVWLSVARVYTPSGRVIQRTYEDLTVEQYESFAASASTARPFRTAAGDTVYAGGGIRPDVEIAAISIPRWWGEAAARGWPIQLADSIAGVLPDSLSLESWESTPELWQAMLTEPLAARVRDSLSVSVDETPDFLPAVARWMAGRVIEVRWSPTDALAFRLGHDAAIEVARRELGAGI